jgi:hypothetical protein
MVSNARAIVGIKSSHEISQNITTTLRVGLNMSSSMSLNLES